MSERQATRSKMAESWRTHAQDRYDADDMFSAFMAGYIALVIISLQAQDSHSGHTGEAEEILAIKEAALNYAAPIAASIGADRLSVARRALRDRELPAGDGYIISTTNSAVINAATELHRYWGPLHAPLNPHEQRNQVAHVVTLLKQTRNRIFHGDKLYDPDGSDAELVRLLCPILFAVVDPLLIEFRGH